MPSTNSWLGLERLAFFDGDDAVLADLVHRLGDDLADLAVVVGGDGGDVLQVLLALDRRCFISLSLATMSSTAFSMPRFMSIGLVPATTALQAFVVDRLGQHGRGGGAVAGDVAGLARRPP